MYICDRRTDRPTNVTKTAFPLVIRVYVAYGPLIILVLVSWFDVNRSIFDEDMREKRFLHFFVPSGLDL